MLPDRIAVGYDIKKNETTEIPTYKGIKVFPVAAFMAPAYLQILRAAHIKSDPLKKLPLYSYTLVGWKNGKFYASGLRIDEDTRQDLKNVDIKLINKQAKIVLKKYKNNRLVNHLINKCVLSYGCPAARNFVLSRWECPVPTSPVCNSNCLGCISKQEKTSGVCASQDRIDFTPTPEEILEFTVPHLENADRPVISFGQGCEGEPLLVGNIIEEAIKLIRKKTNRGIINLNTNGSMPKVVEKLCKAGLDSIRVSINSANKKYYDKYYKPNNYSFYDVVDSLKIIRKYNRWASINYLMFPGFTDTQEEINHLIKLIDKTKLNMIQTRNLNIDPDWYIEELGLSDVHHKPIGIKKWVDFMRQNYPQIKLGYFNPPLVEMNKMDFKFKYNISL
jgi:pyruvate-formate lyase-activating enzyme